MPSRRRRILAINQPSDIRIDDIDEHDIRAADPVVRERLIGDTHESFANMDELQYAIHESMLHPDADDDVSFIMRESETEFINQRLARIGRFAQVKQHIERIMYWDKSVTALYSLILSFFHLYEEGYIEHPTIDDSVVASKLFRLLETTRISPDDRNDCYAFLFPK